MWQWVKTERQECILSLVQGHWGMRHAWKGCVSKEREREREGLECTRRKEDYDSLRMLGNLKTDLAWIAFALAFPFASATFAFAWYFWMRYCFLSSCSTMFSGHSFSLSSIRPSLLVTNSYDGLHGGGGGPLPWILLQAAAAAAEGIVSVIGDQGVDAALHPLQLRAD